MLSLSPFCDFRGHSSGLYLTPIWSFELSLAASTRATHASRAKSSERREDMVSDSS